MDAVAYKSSVAAIISLVYNQDIIVKPELEELSPGTKAYVRLSGT